MNRRRQQARLTKFENGLKGRSGEILLKLQNWQNLNGVSAKKKLILGHLYFEYIFSHLLHVKAHPNYISSMKNPHKYITCKYVLSWLLHEKLQKLHQSHGKAPQMCHLHVCGGYLCNMSRERYVTCM